jgi:hypothetical protein
MLSWFLISQVLFILMTTPNTIYTLQQPDPSILLITAPRDGTVIEIIAGTADPVAVDQPAVLHLQVTTRTPQIVTIAIKQAGFAPFSAPCEPITAPDEFYDGWLVCEFLQGVGEAEITIPTMGIYENTACTKVVGRPVPIGVAINGKQVVNQIILQARGRGAYCQWLPIIGN